MLTFGSLFAGIGGFDLGLERAGMRCVWQVENDPYAIRVLEKHWPAVRRWPDVRTFPPTQDWNAFCTWPYADLICGGFPCQDISNAGRRVGIHGERSGLWRDFARIVGVVRPRFVLVENSAALLGRGIGDVLADLARFGYDAEWDCLPCAAFGALHIRNRVFLLAYPNERFQTIGRHREVGREQREESVEKAAGKTARGFAWNNVHDSYRRRRGTPQETVFAGRGGIELSDWWASEPGVGRVVDGLSAGLDATRRNRCRCLGNAVVPQVAEWLGRRILEIEALIVDRLR